MSQDLRYYYCEDGETSVGPFSESRMRELLAKQVISPGVWLCTAGSDEWRVARDWEEFQNIQVTFPAQLLEDEPEKQKADVTTATAETEEDEAPVIHSSVLAEAFADFTTEEERARELQRLQQAAGRVDLREYRDVSTQREEVPTGESSNKWWFLRYLRWRDLVIGAFVILLVGGIVYYFTQDRDAAPELAEVAADSGEAVTPPAAPVTDTIAKPGTAGVVLGKGLNQQPASEAGADAEAQDQTQDTSPMPDPSRRQRPSVEPVEPPQQTASRQSRPDGSVMTPEYYVLERPYRVKIGDRMENMIAGSRVRVVNRDPDVWTVQANGVRFEVSPADLRRTNNEQVMTVGAETESGE